MLTSAPPAPAAFAGKDGRILFQSDRDGRSYEIYSMKPDGTRVHQLTDNDLYDDGATLSPDTKRIVYQQALGPGEADLFLMRPDGSGQHAITSAPGRDYWPTWSPNGKKIAFVSDRSGSRQIWVMDANGRHQRPVKLNNGLEQDGPVFTPSGKKIVFSGYYDGRIYVMRKDGSHLHRLTNSTAYDEYPDISPNGRKMVFDRTVNMGNQMIFTARVDGTHEKRLTSPSVPSANPKFSPSGKKIVFSSARDVGGKFQVFVMNADGSDQHRLTPIESSSYPTGWGIRP